MTDLPDVLVQLGRSATFSPEVADGAQNDETIEFAAALLRRYPGLSRHPDYLQFMRSYGGAHIHRHGYSLGLLGVFGDDVAAFDEGERLDEEHYLIFGEVLYSGSMDGAYVFAFDLLGDDSTVYIAPIPYGDYAPCAQSFVEFLQRFARGDLPSCEE